MMTTNNIQENTIKDLRKIRDEISTEIKDMTFEEERAYLDKLLNDGEKYSANNNAGAPGTGIVKR